MRDDCNPILDRQDLYYYLNQPYLFCYSMLVGELIRHYCGHQFTSAHYFVPIIISNVCSL